MVSFSYHNLVEDVYPSLLSNTNAMDVIFCRNVLMYFSPECAKKVIQNFYRCLVDGGFIVVSPVEASHVLFSKFKTVNYTDVILYKKDSEKIGECILDESYYEMLETPPLSYFIPGYPEVTPPCEKVEIGEIKKPVIEVEEQKTAGLQPYDEALALFKQGLYIEAEEKLLIVLSQNQENAKAMALLARACANQGMLAEAALWCERAIFADKLNPGCHYLLATILQEQGRIEEAVVLLKRALYLDQNFVLAHFALGNLTRRLGKNRESEKHFANASALLSSYRHEDILPESEGITAGRLIEIIHAMGGQHSGKDR